MRKKYAVPTNVVSDSSMRYSFWHTFHTLHLCHIVYSSINLNHITCDFLETI